MKLAEPTLGGRPDSPVIVVLAGGTGGAKLARGMLEVAGADGLAVIANTGDDVEVYGVHVSPDPDLVTYWLAGRIDERGWGIRGDTWEVMDALDEAGRSTWFRLGDRDFACCLIRTEALRAGARLTQAQAEVARAMGVEAAVLPMADEPVRTFVATPRGLRPFQEFMIVDRAEPPIEGVELRGLDHARPTPEVLDAIRTAHAIVIGPSNPVVSIGPILALEGMREALEAAPAPVVAVSPWVGGRALKGPTDSFAARAGLERGAAGVEAAYGTVLDGVVTDTPHRPLDRSGRRAVEVLQTETLMDTPPARRRLATETLEFAETLAREPGEPRTSR